MTIGVDDRSPGEVLRDVLEALVGKKANYIIGGEPPSFEETLRHYTNAELADAAGLAPGKEARGSFYQRVQRYRNFAEGRSGVATRKAGKADRRQIERLGLAARRRNSTPATLAELLRLVRRHGLTVAYFGGVIVISDEESYREVRDVFCSPSKLESEGFHDAAGRARAGDSPFVWERAFEALWRAWRSSYGIQGAQLVHLDELELELGRQPEKAKGHRRREAA